MIRCAEDQQSLTIDQLLVLLLIIVPEHMFTVLFVLCLSIRN